MASERGFETEAFDDDYNKIEDYEDFEGEDFGYSEELSPVGHSLDNVTIVFNDGNELFFEKEKNERCDKGYSWQKNKRRGC